jgi:hypothetical protein
MDFITMKNRFFHWTPSFNTSASNSTSNSLYKFKSTNSIIKNKSKVLIQYTSYQQSIYYMLGRQVGVVVLDNHDLTHYKNLFEHYKEMLELLMERYQLEEPDFITFRFKTLHVTEDLLALQKNLSNVSLHKGIVKVAKTKKILIVNYYPIRKMKDISVTS